MKRQMKYRDLEWKLFSFQSKAVTEKQFWEGVQHFFKYT